MKSTSLRSGRFRDLLTLNKNQQFVLGIQMVDTTRLTADGYVRPKAAGLTIPSGAAVHLVVDQYIKINNSGYSFIRVIRD